VIAPTTLTEIDVVVAAGSETVVSHSGAAEVTWHCGGLNVTPLTELLKLMRAPLLDVMPELPVICARRVFE
jgi:hypothetical protein